YTISIYDNNTDPNCSRAFPIEVPPAVQPVFTETHLDVSCNGGTDGSITLSETNNGINPLTYTISPVIGTYNSSTRTFEGLTAGSYTVTGTGTNGCTMVIANIIIGEPDPIAITAFNVVQFTCTVDTNTSNHGSITVTGVTGGSGNYFYEFVNNQGTPDIADDVVVKAKSITATYTETNRLGGSYTINVYDDNLCVGSTTTTIDPFDELLTPTISIDEAISCINAGEDIIINAFGSLTDSSTAP